ncbi:MAG: hypothetical protein KAJ24_04135 [Candidatus Aenigmarchaeota archaeon]|nr:hypothetical protein [Candidatus Aenigmarchaeota archaeon]
MPTYPSIGDTNYFTNRGLENDKEEKTGKIIMWRNKGEEKFHIILKCPFCSAENEFTEEFEKRPYRPACPACGKKFIIAKIKAKKKKK